MDLILDEDDVRRLNDAARVLLSPSDHSDLRAWVEAAVRATTRFLKADAAIMILPAADGTVLWSENVPRAFLGAVQEAVTGADTPAPGNATTREMPGGASVFRRRVPPEFGAQTYVGLRTPTPGGPAALGWSHAGANPFAPADSRVAVRLLSPAFRTGVRVALQRHAARQDRPAPAQLPGVREVMAAHDLTRREAEVALLLARGASNRDAAEHLCVSPHTVRKHAEHIFAKLGIHSRTVLALLLALGAGAG